MKTLEQLKAERSALDAQISKAIQTERAEALQTAKKLVQDFEFSARELGLGAGTASTKTKKNGDARASVAPKYRDPQNHANTWTGRGKPPRWLASAMAAGKSKDAFLI